MCITFESVLMLFTQNYKNQSRLAKVGYFLRHSIIHTNRIFSRCFSQPNRISGLLGGVSRFCKKSSVCRQYTHVTDERTDGNAISIADCLLRNGNAR